MRIKFFPKIRLLGLMNRTKLRHKLILSYLVASLLPLMLIGLFLVHKASSIIEEQTNQTFGVSMQQLTDNIEAKLNSYETIANLFYFDNTLNLDLIKDFSRDNGDDIIDAEEAFIGSVNGLLKGRNDIRAIGIYFFNPSLYSAIPYLNRVDAETQSDRQFQAAMASQYKGYWGSTEDIPRGQTYWNRTKKQDAVTTKVFTYNRPLNFYIANQPAGLLTIEIKESELYQLLAKESSDKDIFLVEPDGTIVTSNQRNRLSSALDEELFSRIRQQHAGGLMWNRDDKRYKILFDEADNGWKLVYMIPIDHLLEKTRSMRNYGLVFIFLSVIVSLMLILVFSNLLMSRMKILLRRIQGMKDGEIKIGRFVQGNDEIAVLDHSFNQMAERMKYLIDEVYTLNMKKKEAELLALQSQINPHFLYNTLSTVSWLGRKNGNADVSEIVESLAAFYRISLSKGKEIIPLRDEFACIKAYIDIQQYRLKNRIRPIYTLEEGLMDAVTLKLILQPIVENAILHGLSHEKERITIHIKAGYKEGAIRLEVTDDGAGMAPETAAALLENDRPPGGFSGYGLRNVNERIKLHFGEAYGLRITSDRGEGTSVAIVVPYLEKPVQT